VKANVTVRCEDATAMALPIASFDTGPFFTMLHHGSVEMQNELFAQVVRALKPAACLQGQTA
jgi:hypothetical protein